jgi:hypothetical protein
MVSANESGAVCLFDGECPRTITFKAREDISGACFVVLSGVTIATAGIGPSAGTWNATDFEGAYATAYGLSSGCCQVNGISLGNVTSGNWGTMATRGAYIVKCAGSVFQGTLVQAESCSGVQTVGSVNVAQTDWQMGVAGTKHIGRALTQGIVGSYAIVYLNL